jgi:heme exporter protein B
MGSTLQQTAFGILLRRDLLLAYRKRSHMVNSVMFFLIVTALFPIAISSDKATLTKIAPGVIWVAALLAAMLSLENMFRSDYEDGSLEQFILSPRSLPLLVLGKVFAHWLQTGLPLVMLSPLVGLQYQLSGDTILIMLLALSIGTPVLSLLGAIGAALTLGLRGGGMLLSLLLLPLYVPVLIFGAGAINASAASMGSSQPFLLLIAAFLILALAFTPLAIAAALRISTE